jgi:hypothetical protein
MQKEKGGGECLQKLFIVREKTIEINHYQPIRIVKVMPPEWPQLFLSTNIPNCEYHILILNLLHIETYNEPGNQIVLQPSHNGDHWSF